MVFLTPVLFIGWKLIHRTKSRPLDPTSVDLKGEVNEIDEVSRFSPLSEYTAFADCVEVHSQFRATALQERLRQVVQQGLRRLKSTDQ